MMATSDYDREKTIIGAFHAPPNALRGKTGVLIVYRTKTGTAHAGDLRKRWSVPEGTINDAMPSVPPDAEYKAEFLRNEELKLSPKNWPKLNPLLTCDDKELAEAFERLVKEPSFSKINLTDWEFKLAAEAPSVFIRYGAFTWKQRKYLREIVTKISGKWIE